MLIRHLVSGYKKSKVRQDEPVVDDKAEARLLCVLWGMVTDYW